MKIIIRISAERDIQEVFEYYESARAGLGDDFLNDLALTFNYLSQFPKAFKPAYKKFRIVSLSRFPYLVYFRVVRQQIIIQKIGHAHRSKRKLKV